MEEMTSAFNLIRHNINQISDNADLQAHFVHSLRKFMLSQNDVFGAQVRQLFEKMEHQAPIRHTLKLLDYTNYIKKTSGRAGRF